MKRWEAGQRVVPTRSAWQSRRQDWSGNHAIWCMDEPIPGMVLTAPGKYGLVDVWHDNGYPHIWGQEDLDVQR